MRNSISKERKIRTVHFTSERYRSSFCPRVGAAPGPPGGLTVGVSGSIAPLNINTAINSAAPSALGSWCSCMNTSNFSDRYVDIWTAVHSEIIPYRTSDRCFNLPSDAHPDNLNTEKVTPQATRRSHIWAFMYASSLAGRKRALQFAAGMFPEKRPSQKLACA
jgi:hypothetical protein